MAGLGVQGVGFFLAEMGEALRQGRGLAEKGTWFGGFGQNVPSSPDLGPSYGNEWKSSGLQPELWEPVHPELGFPSPPPCQASA